MRINDLLGDDESILWEHFGYDGINNTNSGSGKKALPVILISIILFFVIPMIMVCLSSRKCIKGARKSA